MGAFFSRQRQDENRPLLTSANDADTRVVTITPQSSAHQLAPDVLGVISLCLPSQSFLAFRMVCKKFLESTRQFASFAPNKEFLLGIQSRLFGSLKILHRDQVTLFLCDIHSNQTHYLPVGITLEELELLKPSISSNNNMITKNVIEKIINAMEEFTTPSDFQFEPESERLRTITDIRVDYIPPGFILNSYCSRNNAIHREQEEISGTIYTRDTAHAGHDRNTMSVIFDDAKL